MTFVVISIRHDGPPQAFVRPNVVDAIDCAFDLAVQSDTEVSAISIIGNDGEWWPKSLMLSAKATARRHRILPIYVRKSAA